MEARSLRYEIKIIAEADAYTLAKTSLRLDPAGIRVLYPERKVQSIYFDTLGQEALEENLAGVSHREKLRFRWYGDGVRAVRGNLELKVRHNLLGWKRVVAIPGPVDVEGAERTALAEAILGALPEDWQELRAKGTMPAQWISYRREYFTTADGRVRITLDREVEAADLRPRLVVTRRFPSRIPRVIIVEVKCAEHDYEAARALLKRFPLPVDKCSKFVLASRPADGPAAAILP